MKYNLERREKFSVSVLIVLAMQISGESKLIWIFKKKKPMEEQQVKVERSSVSTICRCPVKHFIGNLNVFGALSYVKSIQNE